jgi:mannose-6-phosphate isomerase-like protein (cupin superfamily)
MKSRIIRHNTEEEFYTSGRCHILELSNSPDDVAVSISRARIEPGITTRLHQVKGLVERFLILDGTGYVKVGNDLEADLQPGDIVWIPPLCPQCITNTGQTDLILLAICTPRFTPEVYEDLEPTA